MGQFCQDVHICMVHSWVSGADLGGLRECSIAMGKAHLLLEWPKLLWSHLWIDHMYFFPANGEATPNFHASP